MLIAKFISACCLIGHAGLTRTNGLWTFSTKLLSPPGFLLFVNTTTIPPRRSGHEAGARFWVFLHCRTPSPICWLSLQNVPLSRHSSHPPLPTTWPKPSCADPFGCALLDCFYFSPYVSWSIWACFFFGYIFRMELEVQNGICIFTIEYAKVIQIDRFL